MGLKIKLSYDFVAPYENKKCALLLQLCSELLFYMIYKTLYARFVELSLGLIS